jgi:diaminopimelate epimerase
MQGLGNDFVVIGGFDQRLPDKDQWPSLSRRLTDRHFGVGADGVVLVLPSATATVKMRIFNPDGSEAEMCGNAIRCVAKYVYERIGIGKDRFDVETLAGLKAVRLEIAEGKVFSVTVDMGIPILEPENIPVSAPICPVVDWPLRVRGEEFNVTCVSLGNPHCVVFHSPVDEVDLNKWGPPLELHPAFPRRTNVEFVERLGPRRLKVRVWERGAGATLACGTGACAAAVAGLLKGICETEVHVDLPGGELLIEWKGEGKPVYLKGPAEEVFWGEILV